MDSRLGARVVQFNNTNFEEDVQLRFPPPNVENLDQNNQVTIQKLAYYNY